MLQNPLRAVSFILTMLDCVSEAIAGAPSFDCGKAATPIEKLICRQPRLAALAIGMTKGKLEAVDIK
jgi:uncharacterized protein